MTTLTATTRDVADGLDVSRPGVPLSRLVHIELRKLFNTRAAFWLSVAIVALNALITAVAVFTIDDFAFGSVFELLMLPATLLLPVMAILLVTSEWSQRSALITFGLEPRRSRVVVAKLLTSIAAASVAVVSAVLFAALGTALAGAIGDVAADPWEVSVALFANPLIGVLLSLLMGFGFGMVLMNSPAAIVLFFVLPTAWTLVANLVTWIGENLQEWLDFNLASLALSGQSWPTGVEWKHIATSSAVWILLPLVVGTWRLLRSEVK